MKLLSRLRGLVSGDQPAEEAASSDGSAGERSGSRRRRGRRGGRGRGRGGSQGGGGGGGNNQQHGGDTTPVAERTQTKSNSDRGGQSDRRSSGSNSGRRRSDRRPDPRGTSRSARARRGSLDAPLPEDVAFRPTTDGGDGSILPGRRRPPPGARTTNRVLVTGKRNLPDFTEAADEEAEPSKTQPSKTQPPKTQPPDSHDVRHDDSSGPTRESQTPESPAAEGDEAASSGRRRRRGRRGGRGRGGRGAEPSNGSAHDEGRGETPVAASPAIAEAERDERGPVVDSSDFPQAFADLGTSERTLTAVALMGFSEPTPVQERSIPVLMSGRDVVGIAQTGTGKTLAFGIPMVEVLDPSQRSVQGLVLVPTRELAQQVLAVLIDLAQPCGMRAIGLLGGHALEGDFRALEAGPQIVVGTPGRIKDHLRRGTLSLRNVRMAILDEADQMLDIGFLPDITHILGRTPRSRQTALFSATMPQTVMRLVRRYMKSPETIAVASDLETVESIEHVYYEVAQRDKIKGLRELIDRELRGRTLVFSRTKRGVDRVADMLQGLGVNVGALHGDLDQRRRDNIVRRFRGGELDILIATNVAARGIDIPEITHVVNYDVPDNAEEYVHRTGRTGRAGRDGKAISFVSEVDVDRFDVLRETFGDLLHKERLELYV